MLDGFIINALIAGICVSIIAGGLGCFVVWKKMAYFGDSLSHSSLLGIAIGISLGLNFTIGTFITCIIFASLLTYLQNKNILSNDTLLGILAHAALSIGIIAISISNQYVNLDAYLFGDILTVTEPETYWFISAAVLVFIILYIIWEKLVLMTIDENIAKSEGINTSLVHSIFLILLVIFVATCVKVVGILLITSMLIIPAAASRQITNSPTKMAFGSGLIAIASVFIGIFSSIIFDIPTGPSIIAILTIIFILTLPLKRNS